MPDLSLRIVLADDDPDYLKLFEMMLTHLGHHVTCTARNGHELLEACDRDDLDLLITDVNMPRMDGIAAANQLAEKRRLPVIVISSMPPDTFAGRVTSRNIVAFLIKPVTVEQLDATIRTAFPHFKRFDS